MFFFWCFLIETLRFRWFSFKKKQDYGYVFLLSGVSVIKFLSSRKTTEKKENYKKCYVIDPGCMKGFLVIILR